MRTNLHRIRAYMLAVCFSIAGFFGALATPSANQSSTHDGTASPRIVGTGLQFINPLLLAGQDPQYPSGGDTAADPKGYDLGDVCLGSQFTRYICASGGVRPYSMTIPGQQGIPTVTLDPDGRLFGALQTGGQQSINVMVTDAAGATRVGYFRLFGKVFDPSDFRFEMDRLPTAQVGMDYITNLETSNQDVSTVYSVVPQSIFLNNVALPNLEANGLTLSLDGNLAGRPLNSGTLSFTGRATKQGRIALNRSGTAPDQPFTISIAAQGSVQSVLATNMASLSGTFGGKQTPVFRMTAFVNMLPPFGATLRGQHFAFRLGGHTFSTTLNGAGSGNTSNGRVSVSTFAGATLLQLQIRDSALLSLVNSSIADGSKQTLAAEIELGSTFLGTEPIEFSVRNRNGHFKLSYNLSKSRQLGGLFQIANVYAQDGFYNQGTQFFVRFLISNVKGQNTSDFGTPQSATVRIGPGFVQSFPLQGRNTNFSGSYLGIVSAHVNLPGKFGAVNTAILPQSQTNITPVILSNRGPQTFLFGMDLQTSTQTFSGDTSVLLYPVIVFYVFDPFFDCVD